MLEIRDSVMEIKNCYGGLNWAKDAVLLPLKRMNTEQSI